MSRFNQWWRRRHPRTEAQRRVLETGGQTGCVLCEEARRELGLSNA